MGFVKGCSLKKKKSSENCYDPCDPCDNDGDDEPGCADDSSKQACCKPGCSTKKPCVSCIKCGVKPEICRRSRKRTCVLSKSCCK